MYKYIKYSFIFTYVNKYFAISVYELIHDIVSAFDLAA